MQNLTVGVVLLVIGLTQLTLPNGRAHAQRAGRRPIHWVNPKVPEGKGLEHKILPSKSLGHHVGYVVWTPPDFDAKESKRYPVIYFLHGAGGTETSDAYGFSSLIAGGIRQKIVPEAICVFPNGGMSGYAGDVEKMIVEELIPLIDHDYPTQPRASSRVVAGFSMGGAGAVRLSLLHPKLFRAAASWGGVLSFRGNPADSPLLPAARKHAKVLNDNNFSMLLINGDQDRPDAFALLADTLHAHKVAHQVEILQDTDHNLGKYYQKSGDAMVRFLGQHLKRGQKLSRAGDSIRLLVRSDDMGVAHAINEACLDTVQSGIARSIEVIVPGPWFREAAKMLRENPNVEAGVHLDLTSEWTNIKWGPISKNTPSLVDADGNFYPMTSQRKGFPENTGFLESGWRLREVEQELRKQIETALRHLPRVTHLTAHMGTATSTPELTALVTRLAHDYKLPIEAPQLKPVRSWTTASATPEQKESDLVKLLEELKPGTWLLVGHPGLDTPEMHAIHHPGYENVAWDRAGITKAFTSDRAKYVIRRRGIELIRYADLVESR